MVELWRLAEDLDRSGHLGVNGETAWWPTCSSRKTSEQLPLGNGEAETSEVTRIPVAIEGKTGLIIAAVIRGKAPLLLGRPSLEKLN